MTSCAHGRAATVVNYSRARFGMAMTGGAVVLAWELMTTAATCRRRGRVRLPCERRRLILIWYERVSSGRRRWLVVYGGACKWFLLAWWSMTGMV